VGKVEALLQALACAWACVSGVLIFFEALKKIF